MKRSADNAAATTLAQMLKQHEDRVAVLRKPVDDLSHKMGPLHRELDAIKEEMRKLMQASQPERAEEEALIYIYSSLKLFVESSKDRHIIFVFYGDRLPHILAHIFDESRPNPKVDVDAATITKIKEKFNYKWAEAVLEYKSEHYCNDRCQRIWKVPPNIYVDKQPVKDFGDILDDEGIDFDNLANGEGRITTNIVQCGAQDTKVVCMEAIILTKK